MNEVAIHNGKFSSLVFAILGNTFIIISDAINSNTFAAYSRLLGVMVMVLTILNILGVLDPIKQRIKRKLFK